MFGRNKTGIKVKNGKVVYNKRFNNLLDAMINYLLIEKNYKNLNKQALALIQLCWPVYGKYDTQKCVDKLVAITKFKHDNLSWQK